MGATRAPKLELLRRGSHSVPRYANRAEQSPRPRDRAPRGARVRRAGRRAAVPARRHRDRRPPRHPPARRASPSPASVLTAAFGDLQLPRVLHDRRGRPPGRRRRPNAPRPSTGIDGCWLAVGLGARCSPCSGSRSRPLIVDVMGASARAAPFAVTYLRISILGAPAVLLALAGAGYLRGMQDTRTTLVIAVAANVVNLALELRPRLRRSTSASRARRGARSLAQYGAAVAYLVIVAAAHGAGRRRCGPTRPGSAATPSSAAGSSCAPGRCSSRSSSPTAIAARFGDDDVAAHQIAMQVWTCSSRSRSTRIAIAGAGDGRPVPRAPTTAHDARASAAAHARVWASSSGSCSASLVALTSTVAGARCSRTTPTVQHLAEQVLWIVAALQPVGRGGVRARRRAHRRGRRRLPRVGDAGRRRSRCSCRPRSSSPCSTRACSGSGPRSRLGSWRASSAWSARFVAAPSRGPSPAPLADSHRRRVRGGQRGTGARGRALRRSHSSRVIA